MKFPFFIDHKSNLITDKCSIKTPFVNFMISPIKLTITQPKLTAQMEANNALLICLKLENIKLNLAKITLLLDIAAMVTNVSLLMEIMSSILFYVEIYIKLKSVKIFGKKDFVFTE